MRKNVRFTIVASGTTGSQTSQLLSYLQTLPAVTHVLCGVEMTYPITSLLAGYKPKYTISCHYCFDDIPSDEVRNGSKEVKDIGGMIYSDIWNSAETGLLKLFDEIRAHEDKHILLYVNCLIMNAILFTWPGLNAGHELFLKPGDCASVSKSGLDCQVEITRFML